jgi:integrase
MSRPSKPWFWAARDGWYVTIGGKRHRLAEGRGGRAEAEREFHRLMLTAGRVETDPSRLKALDLCDLFLEAFRGQVERGEREQGTLADYGRFLASACKVIGTRHAPDVRPKDVLRWADAHNWNPTSRHDALSTVKVAFRWAHRAGHIATDPLATLELPRPLRREAVPTPAQADAMVAAATGPFRDYLIALRETGCRPIEPATLTADRVDLAGGTWRVRNKTRRKTGEPTRTVYLTSVTIDLTRRLITEQGDGLVFRNGLGTMWTRQGYSPHFLRLRRELGYGPECCAYGLRHLYVTDALERGIPPATVAELVGHTSPTMVMRVYNQLKDRTDHLRDAARAIRSGGPSGPPAPPPAPTLPGYNS